MRRIGSGREGCSVELPTNPYISREIGHKTTVVVAVDNVQH